jgi:CMP-N-acetylneuraminic acid synthetase/quercetin dioxygenase-like cupin family protein
MKKRIIAMIPARLGSQRVKKKNLRLINGHPLVWYAIKNAKEAGIFDEIFVNSESDEIGSIAKKECVNFYKRPAHLSSNSASNDEFLTDFMQKNTSDIVIQINPTSPFISSEHIKLFVTHMLNETIETLHSVKKVQIECIHQGKPLNFNNNEAMKPSQDLEPVYAFSSGIMGFSSKRFLQNMEEHGCAMFGGRGKTGYFTLDGWATLDIDYEDDFLLAEVIAKAANGPRPVPKYYDLEQNQVDLILAKDGVQNVDLKGANEMLTSTKQLTETQSTASWSKRVINTAGYSATLISQKPGQGNRNHYHPDRDEWWVVMRGEIDWTISDNRVLHGKEGDIVFIPKGEPHKITVVGTEPAIRLAISVDDMEHVFI